MRQTSRMFAVVIVMLLGIAIPAADAEEGPFCFTMLPFSNFFAIFIEGRTANQFVGSGRDLASGAALHVSGFTSGLSTHYAITASPDSLTGFPVIMGATIGLRSGSGPGRCHRINSPDGCGTGTAVTLAAATCPDDATSDAPFDSSDLLANPG